MNDSPQHTDEGQVIVDRILGLRIGHEDRMNLLVRAERTIKALYDQGKTSVKPCRYMTEDDLTH
jgi:hypothetical protein